MGEAKRRTAHDTLDGGPASGDRIAIELCIFSPGPDALLSDDAHTLAKAKDYTSIAGAICSECARLVLPGEQARL